MVWEVSFAQTMTLTARELKEQLLSSQSPAPRTIVSPIIQSHLEGKGQEVPRDEIDGGQHKEGRK